MPNLTLVSYKRSTRELIGKLICEMLMVNLWNLTYLFFSKFRAKDAAKQLKKKLGSGSAKVIFLALIVTDMAMNKCGNPMHVQVGTKEFYNVLISILHNQEMKKEVSHFCQ